MEFVLEKEEWPVLGEGQGLMIRIVEKFNPICKMKARAFCWGLVEVGRRLEMFKSYKKVKHIEKMSIQGKEKAIQQEKVIQGEFLAGGGSSDCGDHHASQIDGYLSKI